MDGFFRQDFSMFFFFFNLAYTLLYQRISMYSCIHNKEEKKILLCVNLFGTPCIFVPT